MLLDLLRNPLVQVVAFVAGTLILWRIVKRNRSVESGKKKKLAPQRSSTTAFRDARWGEPPLQGMAIYHDGTDEQLFTRAGDSLKVGDSAVASIVYSYYFGKLQALMIEIPHRSAKDVIATMTEKWGPPVQPDPLLPKFLWNEIADQSGGARGVLDDSPLRIYASLVISSRAVMDERKARGRRSPMGALSGTKAEREVEIDSTSGRRAPLSSLSGAKSRSEE